MQRRERVRIRTAEVLAQREQFRAILSCIADGVLVTDAAGRVTLMNPMAEQLLGAALSESRGKPLSEVMCVFDAESHMSVADPARQVMHERRVVHSHAPLVLKTLDQRETPIAFSVAPVRNTDDDLTGAVVVFRDETQRRKTEQALKSADRRKDEFLATLAHELRNPLAPICMGLELMKLTPNDQAAVADVHQMVERQTRHMVRLIDDLLDVSRITRGKLELRKSLIQFQSVVSHAVDASRPLIEEAGHKLSVQLPPQPVFLEADPDRLLQILSNLINNAAKFTPPGGLITIAAHVHDGTLSLSITDNGRGIAAEQLPAIFEMFNQARGASENGQTGLGIGLTLVKRLVEMHGGTIEATSEGLGLGSTFAIHLPVAQRTSATAAPQVAGDGPESHDASTIKVLLVDDNRDSLSTMNKMVSALGHEVCTAKDGLEAVAAAETFRPEVILMDLGMPVMNGYEAAREIRCRPWGQQMSLVAVTGWGQYDDRRRTQAAGFDAHLVKPLQMAALTQALAVRHRNAWQQGTEGESSRHDTGSEANELSKLAEQIASAYVEEHPD